MKYLIIALMSLTANAKDPLFYKGERVLFKTGFFLHKVCSGKGRIYEYNEGSNTYTVEPPANETDCPSFISGLRESDLKDNEK